MLLVAKTIKREAADLTLRSHKKIKPNNKWIAKQALPILITLRGTDFEVLKKKFYDGRN